MKQIRFVHRESPKKTSILVNALIETGDNLVCYGFNGNDHFWLNIILTDKNPDCIKLTHSLVRLGAKSLDTNSQLEAKICFDNKDSCCKILA